MTRALILGRFQPPHDGHLHAIADASRRHDEVIVVVGSAQESYTPLNPFTAGERLEMLGAALREKRIRNALLVPLSDINRHGQWVAYVESTVPPFDEVVTNNPLTKVLFEAGGYRVRTGELHRRDACSATRIRTRLAQGRKIDDAVGPAVRKILRRIRAGARLRDIGRAGDVHGTTGG